jgi:hypothetical protein
MDFGQENVNTSQVPLLGKASIGLPTSHSPATTTLENVELPSGGKSLEPRTVRWMQVATNPNGFLPQQSSEA